MTMSFGPAAGVPLPSMTEALRTIRRGYRAPLVIAVCGACAPALKDNTSASAPCLTKIRYRLQRVVEAVRKICNADHQRQFDNLIFAVILLQLLQRPFAHRGRPSRHPLRIE